MSTARLPSSLRRPWLAEIALFAAALVVYQGSRALVVGSPATAFANAEGVIGLEKATGLFVETDIQGLVMGHQGLVSLLNQFYLSAHWIVTPLFFIWLYRSRHQAYPLVRNAFLVANGIALVVFMLFPVAPPRLAGAREGFVDTLHSVSGVDLHGGAALGLVQPARRGPLDALRLRLPDRPGGSRPGALARRPGAPCGLPGARPCHDRRHRQPLPARRDRRRPGRGPRLRRRRGLGARARAPRGERLSFRAPVWSDSQARPRARNRSFLPRARRTSGMSERQAVLYVDQSLRRRPVAVRHARALASDALGWSEPCS